MDVFIIRWMRCQLQMEMRLRTSPNTISENELVNQRKPALQLAEVVLFGSDCLLIINSHLWTVWSCGKMTHEYYFLSDHVSSLHTYKIMFFFLLPSTAVYLINWQWSQKNNHCTLPYAKNSVVLLSNSPQCLVLVKTRDCQYGLQMTVIRLSLGWHTTTPFDLWYWLFNHGRGYSAPAGGQWSTQDALHSTCLSNKKHIHDN